MPQAKIGVLLKRPTTTSRRKSPQEGFDAQTPAKYQFLNHIQYLMDTKTGLWFHGYQFDGQGGRT